MFEILFIAPDLEILVGTAENITDAVKFGKDYFLEFANTPGIQVIARLDRLTGKTIIAPVRAFGGIDEVFRIEITKHTIH